MRAGWLGSGGLLGLAIAGCASAPPPPPEVGTPAVPIAAAPGAAAAAPAAPEGEPADMLAWMRLGAPARDLPVLGTMIPANPSMSLVLAHPELAVRGMVGEALADVIDLDQPLDFAVPIAAPHAASGTSEHFSVAFTLRGGGPAPGALRDSLRVTEDEGGRLQLEPLKPGAAGMIGTSLRCELWPSRGDLPGRLVCANAAPMLASYAPFLARVAPRSAARGAVWLRLTHAGLRAAAAQPDDKNDGPRSDAEEAGERLGKRWAEEYLGDTATLDAEVVLHHGLVELVLEQTFHQSTSVVTATECAKAGAPEAPPDAFWRLPAEADAAFFFQGAPPEVMKPRGARALREFMEALPDEDLPASLRAEAITALGKVFLTGGPLVVAYGQDRATARRFLDKLPDGGGKRDAAADKALVAARMALGGWTLVHLDEPPARWIDGMHDLVRIFTARYPAGAKGKAGVVSGAAPLKDDPKSRMIDTMREIPVRPTDHLPKGALHVVMSSRPNPSYAGEPGVAHETHIFLAPDGAGTWIALADVEGLGRDKIAAAIGSSGATLRGRTDVGALRAQTGAGVGFVTIGGVLSLFLPESSHAQLLEARTLLAQAATLPKRGAAPVPVLWTSSEAPGAAAGPARPCRARFSLMLGPDALADALHLLQQQAAGGEP